VLGAHEHLPEDVPGMSAWFEKHSTYRREAAMHRSEMTLRRVPSCPDGASLMPAGQELPPKMRRISNHALLLCVLSGVACGQQANPGVSQPLVADGAELTRVASGFSFTEGPATDQSGNVFFTDQPNDRILKWSTDGTVSVYMEGAGRANGLYFDRSGGLLACADADNQLWRISPDKEVSVLVADVDDKRLNGPNDVWVSNAGGTYFTDPYYQRDYWSRTEPEIGSENVYYLSLDGELSIADDSLVKPNGIIGTGDGSRLYVADIGADTTYVYQIAEDGTLGGKRVFASMGSDGMTIDKQGNVYLTGDGVTVFSPAGERIGHIAVDAPWTSNVTFGGRDRNILFITATDSVYTLEMSVQGVRW
jgi:gluconolactonase